MKTFNYSNVKYTPRIALILLIVKEIECEIFDLFFLSSSFPPSIAQQVYIWHIWTIFTPNDCTTTRDDSFLIRAACKLRSASYGSKHVTDSFLYAILGILTGKTRNVKVIYERSTYQMTALLSDMLFTWLELYARYDRQVMDPNTHCNLFLIQNFTSTYTHNLKTTHRI